ncbi:hypothetical protein TNCT_334471 [Trichonephila clavata]|uniref:Uncharacterized protein n=1 Tax=Trichonephila clavata TaxID=2740835 RepID=A0A8X6HAP1_TRICU|nr:hypothetical protein TNCT_334471 [Trichonephila clavata]
MMVSDIYAGPSNVLQETCPGRKSSMEDSVNKVESSELLQLHADEYYFVEKLPPKNHLGKFPRGRIISSTYLCPVKVLRTTHNLSRPAITGHYASCVISVPRSSVDSQRMLPHPCTVICPQNETEIHH